uniref:AP-3 complex subunit delta n=1 Tax=Plectus sambesii TaxID=2011161 RepID=A0A914VDM2_9BILA
MALRKVRNNIDRIFDKSLTDLIRGIRNNKDNEAKYIAACIDEIKHELRQDSTVVKTNAIEKLSYLQMMGYDISWASFNIIEVMASTKYTEKRIGYLTASQCFHDETDVLMLTTNMMRKDLSSTNMYDAGVALGGLACFDLSSTNMYDAGVALGGLACFVTTDLARDLANDVVTLLSSSRPYIRKRAVLLLYKIFLKYPESLRPTFPRLKEKLEDPDPGVQSAAVNVICELARKNPKNYLSLAPVFFKLMTTSSNNWMLIKIIKLFGALVPLEPRLGKKLLEPLTNLINSTSAMSLLYECINTVIAVLISVSAGTPGDHTASIQLCVQKLGVLIEDSDQNLKYLGLLAMGKILQTHPKAVQAHKDIVLACLDDKDESIRIRALDLLYGMVSKKNIMEIVRKLMSHVDGAEGSNYRDELLSRIIQICSHNNYQYITNFEWYVSVLVELTKVEGTKHGAMIAEQVQDVTVRVQSIRHFAVSQMALLIENAHLLLAGSAQHRSNVSEVLLAAAWICGEYSEHVQNVQSVLESMLKAKVSMMPGHIQSTFVQNIAKLYAVQLSQSEQEDDWDAVESLDNLMLSKLPQFEQTDNLEGQERACTLLEMVREIEKLHAQREKIAADVTALFEGELNPVAAKAQRKVPLPPGLDLDTWINEPPAESSSSESEEEPERKNGPTVRSEFAGFGAPRPFGEEAETKKKYEQPSPDEMKKMRAQRQADIESNPYYVKGDAKATAKRPTKLASRKDSDEKAVEATPLDLQSPLEIPGVVGLNKYMEQQESTLSWKKAKKEKRKKKGKKGRVSSSDDEDLPVVHQVNRADGEMPEGAKSTDDEEEGTKKKNGTGDPYKALDMDLDQPLREDERLPVAQHRVASLDLGHPAGLKSKADKKTKKSKTPKAPKAPKEEKPKKSKKSAKEVVDEPPPPPPPAPTAEPQDDMDFWLSASSAPAPPAAAEEKVSKKKSRSPEKEKKPKKSEKHHGKESKRKQRHSSTRSGEELVENAPHHLAVHDKNEYEVASGVCTPSKQTNGAVEGSATPKKEVSTPTNLPPMTSYHLLAENAFVRMTYETRVSTADANQVASAVIFANVGANEIRQIEFNVLDSLNTKMLRDPAAPQGALKVPFNLPQGVSNEHVFRFAVEAINVPQKLRGTLTFLVETENGSVPEKIDFHLKFPCVSFTVPATIGSDAFSELISSGELEASSSLQFATTDSLNDVVRNLCFHGHFT